MWSYRSKIAEKMQKSTSDQDDKRWILYKKLESQSAEKFREINIDQFDLNVTQHFMDVDQIDMAVTPLVYTSFFGLAEITRILLKNKKIDIDMETKVNKETALITACRYGNYEIVRILLLANAEPNKPNRANESPLAATLLRLVEEPLTFENKKICFLIAELLVKHGADPNWIIDKKKGHSLLHYFCNEKGQLDKSEKKLNYDLIKFLLQKGADSKQMTLDDKRCQELLKGHCNEEEILNLIDTFRRKEAPSANQINNIKKIDANFFSIPQK